jgi:hypothetical protein
MVAQYADSCNLFGGAAEVAPKLEILRGHCEGVSASLCKCVTLV